MPGIVFSRDKSGQTLAAVDLLDAKTRADAVRFYPNAQSIDATRTGVAAATLSVALLDKIVPNFTAHLSAQNKKDLKSTVSYKGLSELRTYDEPIHTLVRNWAKTAQLSPERQYYVIRDALVADAVTMTLSQQRVIELKLDAALSKVASGTGGVTVDSGANYNLTSTFKPPTPVCITVEQFDVIVPPAAPGGGSVPAPIIANFAPVTPGLAIRTVIHGK